jgi:hypothetical protein
MSDPSFSQALHARVSGSSSCLADLCAQDAVVEDFFGDVMLRMPIFGDGFRGWRSIRPTRKIKQEQEQQKWIRRC